MEERNKRKKKILVEDNLKETREERVLKKFEQTKTKWKEQNRILKEKTKKKETLADLGENYREKNEVMKK